MELKCSMINHCPQDQREIKDSNFIAESAENAYISQFCLRNVIEFFFQKGFWKLFFSSNLIGNGFTVENDRSTANYGFNW